MQRSCSTLAPGTIIGSLAPSASKGYAGFYGARRSTKLVFFTVKSFEMPLMLWWPVAFDPASPVGTPCHLFLSLLLHLRKSRVWTAQIVARALSAKESFPWRLGFVLCAPSAEVGIAGQTLAVSRGKTRSTTAAGRDLERTRGFQSPAIAVIEAQNNAFNLLVRTFPALISVYLAIMAIANQQSFYNLLGQPSHPPT